MSHRLKAFFAFALLTALSSAAIASAEFVQEGNVRIEVTGELAPKTLPRKGSAPISVSVGGHITTTDKSPPPRLTSINIELNRAGRIDSTGLPVCDYHSIQPASSSRALSACRPSLVGQGSFSAEITLAGQNPYPTKGKLIAFNGREHGRPVLFAQIYSPHPFPTSFVIVFKIEKGKGSFGTDLDADLPKTLGTWGKLTGIEMKLSRSYSYKGRRHSYVSAGCPAPKGFPGASFKFARTTFGFQGGKSLNSTLTRSCKARG